jgi:hypothetical protein
VTGLTVGTSVLYQSLQRLREQLNEQRALSDIFAYSNVSLNLLADGRADEARGQVATGNYHLGLGVQPFRGRWFTPEDDQPNASLGAVLSPPRPNTRDL